jgi:hypothetical protein
MRKIQTFANLFLIMYLFCISTSFADDTYPPEWRGNPGTSWVRWEFMDEETVFPASPDYDDGYLPYGDPTIEVTPGPGAGWFDYIRDPFSDDILYDPEGDSGYGWFNLSGEIEVLMQNSDNTENHKEIWI